MILIPGFAHFAKKLRCVELSLFLVNINLFVHPVISSFHKTVINMKLGTCQVCFKRFKILYHLVIKDGAGVVVSLWICTECWNVIMSEED